MSEVAAPDTRVEVIRLQAAYEGHFRIDAYQLRHKKYAGGWTSVLNLEMFERGQTAVVLPYDAIRDRVVLVEQFRIGAYAAGVDPWLTEAVAGTVEPGESVDEVVRREAREEAGCEVNELAPIGTFMLTPGACSEACTMFCGRVDSEGIGGIHGLDAEGEDIRATVVPADHAIARAARGEISSAYGAIPLLWLALHRDDLRARWA